MEVVQSDATVASSGNSMIVVKFRCLTGPYANKHVTNNFVIVPDNPTALNIFFRNMKAFGLDDAFFTQLGNNDHSAIAVQLTGKRAKVTLEHRQWNGGVQNQVKSIAVLTGSLASSPSVMGPPSAQNFTPSNFVPDPVQPQTLSANMDNPSVVSPPPPTPPYAAPAPAPAPAPTPGAAVQAAAEYVASASNAPAAQNGAPAASAAPAGYPPEVWAMMPDAAKQAILSAQQGQPI